MKNLADEQGIAHTKYILGNIRYNQDSADTIIILLESYAIATGITLNPLSNHQTYEYVKSPWLDETRTFLHQTNCTIDIPRLHLPVLIRTRDREIMPLAQEFTTKTKILTLLNASRLFLQITTLAEIYSQTGTHLLQYAITGECNAEGQPKLWNISSSKLRWPHQSKPPAKTWKVWSAFMRSITKRQSKTELKRYLGGWNENIHKHRQWHFRVNVHNTIKYTNPKNNVNQPYSIFFEQDSEKDEWATYHQVTSVDRNNKNEWYQPAIPNEVQTNTIILQKGSSSHTTTRKPNMNLHQPENQGDQRVLQTLLTSGTIQIACTSTNE